MSKPMRKNTKQILKVKTKKRTNPKQEKKMVKIGLIVIDAMQGATITWAKKQLSFRLSVQPDSDTYFTLRLSDPKSKATNQYLNS